MILFSLPSLTYLKSRDGSKPMAYGQWEAKRFSNGEWHITIKENVRGKVCGILGSIAPPDDQPVITLLLADTLKKEDAKSVLLLAPYLAYTRHDKALDQESLATAWIGNLCAASHTDTIITIDVHSKKTQDYLPLPIVSLSPASLFGAALRKDGWQDATVVAPDEGALLRARDVQQALAIQHPVAFFKKIRKKTGIVHSDVIGTVSKKVILVDDILDTGGTLLSACRKLRRHGVEDIAIAVTHGLFTGKKWNGLFQENVTTIYCTNSTRAAYTQRQKQIRILSIAPLLSVMMTTATQ